MKFLVGKFSMKSMPRLRVFPHSDHTRERLRIHPECMPTSMRLGLYKYKGHK